MSVLDRHLGFVAALRAAGLPVSLAEDLDAARAVSAIGWERREVLREAYAATLIKRRVHRPSFDDLFDLWFPARLGSGSSAPADVDVPGERDTAEALRDVRDRLADAVAAAVESPGDAATAQTLDDLAVEAVGRFGVLASRAGSGSGWSAYSTAQRVGADELVGGILEALGATPSDTAARAQVAATLADWQARVDADVRRRIAENTGPEHLARTALRPSIDALDFTSAHRADLDRMRREIAPLARRLATRLTQERHASRGRDLDVRRTVRASMSTGGVPLTTHHRARRPHRSELVVLCDVSGSVANFAQFTLLLVFALREQFTGLRAFTFVDTVHEVTDAFRPGDDAADVLARLADRTRHAAIWGRTHYGRAFTDFTEQFPDAIGPRTTLLILGDARSNHGDLALDRLAEMTSSARQSWWLNPEHPRHWGTGDSAAPAYRELVEMVECRNLTQLGEFVHDLV